LFYTSSSPPDLYTLSLHDALPICRLPQVGGLASHVGSAQQDHLGAIGSQPDIVAHEPARTEGPLDQRVPAGSDVDAGVILEHRSDRKSTRLNSSHVKISYAVFCLK